jgi:hypothetical protein
MWDLNLSFADCFVFLLPTLVQRDCSPHCNFGVIVALGHRFDVVVLASLLQGGK